MERLLSRICSVCGAAAQTPLPKFSSGQWRVVACDGECGFVYLANPPEYEQLSADLAWEKQSIAENQRRYKERSSVLQTINQATRWRLHLWRQDRHQTFAELFRSGKVLDIGCGAGQSIPSQFVPYGIEISRQLFERADAEMRPRGGYAIHAPANDAIKTFSSDFFDGVIMRSVLEHEKDPHTLLSEVHRVLAPAGSVYVRVPNFGSVNRMVMGKSWCGFRYPDHVNYFTPKTLGLLAEKTGFRLRRLNPLGIFDDNIKVILSKT